MKMIGLTVINVFNDMSVPEDSKCAKCCLHCEEKETYRCQGIDEWKTEENIAKNCIECTE